MEKLLYESEEAPSGGITSLLIVGRVISVVGILFFLIALLDKEHLVILLGLGIILAVVGIASMVVLPILGKSRFQIYERHIEGEYFESTATSACRKKYYYTFEQITGAQLKENVVTIYSVYQTKELILENNKQAEEVHQYLQEMIYNRKP